MAEHRPRPNAACPGELSQLLNTGRAVQNASSSASVGSSSFRWARSGSAGRRSPLCNPQVLVAELADARWVIVGVRILQSTLSTKCRMPHAPGSSPPSPQTSPRHGGGHLVMPARPLGYLGLKPRGLPTHHMAAPVASAADAGVGVQERIQLGVGQRVSAPARLGQTRPQHVRQRPHSAGFASGYSRRPWSRRRGAASGRR